MTKFEKQKKRIKLQCHLHDGMPIAECSKFDSVEMFIRSVY